MTLRVIYLLVSGNETRLVGSPQHDMCPLSWHIVKCCSRSCVQWCLTSDSIVCGGVLEAITPGSNIEVSRMGLSCASALRLSPTCQAFSEFRREFGLTVMGSRVLSHDEVSTPKLKHIFLSLLSSHKFSPAG